MSERTQEYIGSLERAMDIVEGQLGLARTLNATAVQVQTELLQQIYDEVLRLRNEAESAYDHLHNVHYCNCF